MGCTIATPERIMKDLDKSKMIMDAISKVVVANFFTSLHSMARKQDNCRPRIRPALDQESNNYWKKQDAGGTYYFYVQGRIY